MENKEVKVKVCLVGSGGVGKTSLIRRYVNDMFDDKYIATIGTKVTKKEIPIKDQNDSEIKMDMMIWDIMGQKGFKQLLQAPRCIFLWY
jgi:GTPase SAR1 family protein